MTKIRPILYSFRRCPYAMRARLALHVSGAECEIREIRLSDKPAEMIAASSKATVPVLVLPDGRVVDESLDIMRWALDMCDPEGWRDREDKALIAENDGAFKHHLDRYKYPDRHDSDPVEHRAAGLQWLQMLDDMLAGRAYLNGDLRGLTDAAIMPFVRQFAHTDRAWFDVQPLPGLHGWLAAQLASPLFAAVMTRPPPWRPGDPVTLL